MYKKACFWSVKRERVAPGRHKTALNITTTTTTTTVKRVNTHFGIHLTCDTLD